MLIVQSIQPIHTKWMGGWMDDNFHCHSIYKNWSWWLLEDSAHSSDVKTSSDGEMAYPTDLLPLIVVQFPINWSCVCGKVRHLRQRVQLSAASFQQSSLRPLSHPRKSLKLSNWRQALVLAKLNIYRAQAQASICSAAALQLWGLWGGRRAGDWCSLARI